MMSKKIQKAAYVFSFLALAAVAFLGLSSHTASADYDGYWDGYYYPDYGYDNYSSYGGYYDPYDGYYDQPSNWYDYGGYDDYYGYGNYDDYYGYGNYEDYYGYGNCAGCSYGYDDYYSYGYDGCYYDCYDYGYDYDNCYYYDCYGNYGTSDTIVDVWNYNVNRNTIIDYADDYDHYDHDDDDDDEDFDVICIASDDDVEEGDRVTFRARVDGVDEDDVDFEWSGDVDGDDEEVSERFNREGRYRATVEAEYRGNIERDTCTIEVEDDNDDRDNNRSRVSLVSTPPTGTPASGVYLSQVPYTGAADNMKLIGFITMLTLASLVGAYYVVTRKARADRKSFIERFKQENLAAKIN